MLNSTDGHGQLNQTQRAEALALRKAGEFAKAAAIYESMWPDGNLWTGWAYAFCLRKSGNVAKALVVSGQIHEMAPDFEMGTSEYAWALSETLKSATEIDSKLLGAAREVALIISSTKTAYEAVNPFVLLVLRSAKLLSRKGRYDAVLEWLELLNPEMLRDDEFTFTDSAGKVRHLASNKESFHRLKTHSLEKLGRWEECHTATVAALSADLRLHHGNGVWFARRFALAKIALGQVEDGLVDLKALAKQKPVSFLHCDIAKVSWTLGNDAECERNCVLALLSAGEIGFKLEALLLLARVLWRTGRADDARRHLALVIAYRTEHSWRLPQDVRTLASEWQVSETSTSKQLLEQLIPHWRELARQYSPIDNTTKRHSGTVQLILRHGKAGFILSDGRERLYFNTKDWRDKKRKPDRGARVTFVMKDSVDPKNNKPSIVALDIRGE